MLPKKKRLTTKEFSHFFSSGKRIHGAYLQLIYTPSPVFHAAAVAGKKVAKTAVGRNKLRRRLYAVLYRISRARELTGVYILIAKPGATKADFRALATEIEELVGKAQK